MSESSKKPVSQNRTTGLASMAVSTAAFVGTTSDVLPAVTFFPALALFLCGAFWFLRSNRAAHEEAERRVKRATDPRLRPNRHAEAHAMRQAQRRGEGLDRSSAAGRPTRPAPADPPRDAVPSGEALDFDPSPGEFLVETDVSFPVDVQEGDALADQLKKLSQLLEQGVLTAEEYAVAKAKLLG